MGFGIDGSIIGDLIDFLALAANLGDGVFFSILQLLDDAFHDIDEDYLLKRVSEGRIWGHQERNYFIAGYVEFLSNETSSNVPPSEVNRFLSTAAGAHGG